MFNNLTDKLQDAFRKLRGVASLSESNISEAMDDVRTAMLDADVNREVVEEFIAEVQKGCLGSNVIRSITPGQMAVKIVNDKLVELSMEQLKKMKAKLKNLPLSIELPDFYPAWVREGKLSKGSVKDLAAIGKVMLQCSGNQPSQLVTRSAAAMKEGKNMVAVIPVAGHTSVNSGALRRRDWNDLVRALGYFVNSTRKQNCSGVIIRPLSELGYMLLEQD